MRPCGRVVFVVSSATALINSYRPPATDTKEFSAGVWTSVLPYLVMTIWVIALWKCGFKPVLDELGWFGYTPLNLFVVP